MPHLVRSEVLVDSIIDMSTVNSNIVEEDIYMINLRIGAELVQHRLPHRPMEPFSAILDMSDGL